MIDEKELPKDWEIVALGDIVEKMTNGASVQQFEEKNGYPISRIETIWNQTIDLDRVKYIKENDPAFVEKYAIRENDILFSHINSDPHLGKTAIFKLKNFTLIHGINLLLIRASQKVYADYLNYQLIYLRRTGIFARIAQKSVNQSSINQAKLKKLEIILPPLNEQYRIVEKIEELFSELDKGIENLKAAQKQLKVYRQAVLKWAFEGKLTDGNVKDGELPEGWQLKRIADMADVNPKIPNKGSIPDSMDVQFLPMKLVEEVSGKINLTELRLYGEVKKGYTPFINDDVIFAKVTPCMENGKIAVVDKLRNGIGFGSSEFHVIRSKGEVKSQYLFNFLVQERFRSEAENSMTGAVGLRRVPKQFIENYLLPVPPDNVQDLVIQEIESRLSVCDKIEETITNSLQQSEALRQSILKKAFEGKLVKAEIKSLYKPKNTYFYQMQLLGIVAAASKEKGINHGEMTIAKYAYLLDKVYQIPTYYDYKRWHLGPYPPEIKKAINNAKFFTKKNNAIEVKDIDTLTKYTNPYSDKLKDAVDDLSDIFARYTGNERPHQIELLATVCKVIEDIQSTDLKTIRASMTEWKIDLATTRFKNKAEKFSEEETEKCLKLINNKGWHLKLLRNE